MVSIGQYKMMPMAPNNSLIQLAGSKPKIGFSIDSIVGGTVANQRTNLHTTNDSINLSPRSSSPEINGRPTSPYSDDCNINYSLELRNQEFRSNIERKNLNEFQNNNNNINNNNRFINRQLETNSNYQNRDTDRNFELKYNLNQLSRSPIIFNNNNNNLTNKRNRLNSNSPQTVQGPLSPDSSVKSLGRTTPNSLPTSPKRHQQNSDSPSAIHDQEQQQQRESSTNNINSNNNNNTNTINKGPIVVPGIPAGLIRPFPVQHPPNINDIKTMPPYINGPSDMTPNPHHILAAQFQMAAALAHHGQTSGGHGFPHGAGIPGHPHHPQFGNPNLVRDSYPLYPWLLSRHGRIFPHRFPGHFLLQPFRKPKRVRTAFSPTQLLKLEHAFEGNHYVVGAERKTLAQSLNLTETQVKVWFQNRRTKHKRMQQEDDAKGNGNNGERKNLNDCTQTSYEDDEDDDELIDMDDCPSDQEMDHYN